MTLQLQGKVHAGFEWVGSNQIICKNWDADAKINNTEKEKAKHHTFIFLLVAISNWQRRGGNDSAFSYANKKLNVRFAALI